MGASGSIYMQDWHLTAEETAKITDALYHRNREDNNNTSSSADSSMSRCPFAHGTVYAAPYPGYIHGKNPAIDCSGCIPELDPHPHETPKSTLLREAFEYQVLFHRENSSPPGIMEARFKEIESSIHSVGTYELTLDDLQYGARVAWRNAQKCANRSKWKELSVIDLRNVCTNQEAFRGILDLLEKSLTSMATITSMAVFRQRLPGETQGPRIWNSMLLRFAGYEGMGSEVTGGILGDPVDANFTKMLIDRFGWIPPSPRTAYDPLPLLLQIKEKEAPELFQIPSSYIPYVHIRHSNYPQLDILGLKWFPVPVVSGLEFHVGGLFFTAVPFVGWFADYEVVRNLTDSSRYNVLPALANALRLDTSPANECWKEEASIVLNKAILASYMSAGFSMVSHHAMLSEFLHWYEMEKKTRGYCPGNWKWIIPPIGASLCDAYLKLNKMTEFTLKPAIMPPRPAGWRNYTAPNTSSLFIVPAPVKKMSPLLALTAHTNKMKTLSLFFKHTTSSQTRPTIFIVYASVTGVAAGGAKRLASLCKAKCRVYLVNAADWDPLNSWSALLCSYACLLHMGPGMCPIMRAASCSGYFRPVSGSRWLAPLGKVDALSSSEFTFATWVVRVFSGLTDSMERESHELRANLANNDIHHEIVSKLHMALDYFVSQLKPDLLHTAISHSIYYLTSDSSCSIACKWSNTQTGIVSNTRVLFETNNESGRESERVVTCVSCDVRQPCYPNSESGIGHAPFPTPTTVRKALQTFLGIESRPSVESLRRLIGYAKDSDAIRLTDTLSDSSGRAVDQWLLTNFITW
eukprot:gene27793-36595_t